jgi:hypothetical protein
MNPPASPAPSSELPAPSAQFTTATFAELQAACVDQFPVYLLLGGELVPDADGRLTRQNAKKFKLLVRRLTSEEGAYAAELLNLAVAKRQPDPKTGELRYDFEDPEFLKERRQLENLVRAYILIRCVPEMEAGWNQYRLSQQAENPKLGKNLKTQRSLVELQAKWLAESFPDDLLEKLRRAADSDVVDEEGLADFFSSGS